MQLKASGGENKKNKNPKWGRTRKKKFFRMDVDDLDFLELLDDTGLLPENELIDLSCSKFLKLAVTNNLLKKDQKYTIFLPPDDDIEYDDGETDGTYMVMNEGFWMRHVTTSSINIHQNCVTQVKLSSNITFGIYSIQNDIFIASVKIKEYNQIFDNCIIHNISTALPDLNFVSLYQLPLIVLSRQTYDLDIIAMQNVQVASTCNIAFFECTTRKQLSCTQCDWSTDSYDDYHHIKFDIPHVNSETAVTMWVQIVADELRIPLMSWLRPHTMTIYPNLQCHLNPVIYDINPQQGTVHQALWIHGDFFSPEIVRVSIGEKFAVIYSCTTSLIKCILPDNTFGMYTIQVANGNIYSTCEKKFVYK